MLLPKPQNYNPLVTRSSSSPRASHPATPVQSHTIAPNPTVRSLKPRTHRSRCVPWLLSIAYPLARYALLPFYFRRIEVVGRENLPTTGPIILAPTHRSRWDALIVPYAVGQDITGRMLRFMVSADEMKGIQGSLIRRLGGFPVNTRQPAIATLRHSIELLQREEALVIFPEGDIYRQCQSLKPGLARLALQAQTSQPSLGIQIVPIGIQYSQPLVPWRSAVKIRIGDPLKVADYELETPKASAKRLTAELERVLRALSGSTCPKHH